MSGSNWLQERAAAFRLMIATSWLAPDSWRDKQEKAIRLAVEAGPDWTEYLRLVEHHRTPALSWASLSRFPEIVIPLPTSRELQKRSDECRIQAVRHFMFLTEVLKSFSRARIPAMPFKGPILSFELYSDVGLRQSIDLDVAVEEKDVDSARSCLEKLGWKLDSTWFPMTPRQWKSVLRHEQNLRFIHSVAGVVLELHWRNSWNTPELTKAEWARRVPCVWHGCSFQAMNSGDLALYLCNHGGQHFWLRAKWLGDLARLHASGLVDWERASREARTTGQENALLAGLQMLNYLYELPLPELQGNPWPNLQSLLTDIPLQALKETENLKSGQTPTSSEYRLRLARYERLLWPRKRWWNTLSDFLYHRGDFGVVSLPDHLFWLYLPLRPLLWAWRRIW